MNRETTTVKIAGHEVDLVSFITWGEKEQIQGVMIEQASVTQDGASIGGKAVLEAKYKSLEICVKEIRKVDKDGKEIEKIPFTRDWINSLRVEDGEAIYGAVDNVTNPKKK